MSSSDDIENLFRQIGRSPVHYQELARERTADEGRRRWPLLAAIDPGEALWPPAAVSGMPGAVAVQPAVVTLRSADAAADAPALPVHAAPAAAPSVGSVSFLHKLLRP